MSYARMALSMEKACSVWRPRFILKDLEKLFQYNVFKMLLSRKKITEDRIEMLLGWRHSGFNVFCGSRIRPNDEKAMDNLARYIVRASFSQERMTYLPEKSKVLYQSKDGKEEKAFDALEWLAAACSLLPNKGVLHPSFMEIPLKARASAKQVSRFLWHNGTVPLLPFTPLAL